MTATKTLYAKCLCDIDKHLFHLMPWVPWLNVDDKTREYFPMMVLRRWIRSRGGVARHERFNVTVYVYEDDTPCYPSGLPMSVTATTFAVNYEDREPCHDESTVRRTTATTKAPATTAGC